MFKVISTIPFLGTFLGLDNKVQASGAKALYRDIYKELGVRTVINATGTYTYLTGSLMRPEVLEAINYGATQFVDINELQDKVGARLASLLKCEAAMVTSGAASALTLGTAASITGMDPDKIIQIPEYSGPRPEVIIQKKHRFGYDHAVRNTGIKMVEVENRQEMEKAINKNTVMMLFLMLIII
jgi:L-seryl-tRNA(Ser) seleniumtransferase